MDAQILALKNSLEGKIDFEGQLLSERLSQQILAIFGVLAFLLGFALQNLLVTCGVFAVGLLITALVVIPSWPMYNSHPVNWLSTTDIEKKKA